MPSTQASEPALHEHTQWAGYDVPTWEEVAGQDQDQDQIQYQEGVDAGDELDDVQFDGDWDWNAGHFLSPDLWPRRES